jgi:hypothetical protein
MTRSFIKRTPLLQTIHHLETGLILAILISSNAMAGIFFSHPRDGRFKFVTPGDDPWYYLNPGQLEFQTPDKWQHYMGNYLFCSPSEKLIGKWPTIVLFTSINILKELEDGYREGASVKDLGVGFAGMFSSLTGRRIICVFDEEKILLKYFVSLDAF